MSYTYGFFDAVDLGGGNFDRVYSSAEFSHYWALLVGDGVFGQPSTSLNVLAMEPVAMRVKVSPGTGWIKGHYLTVPDNMDEVILVPVANPSLPRIDSIIMALNNADRDMKLYLRSGNAAASPKPVTLQRDADVWELELAQITVAAGAGNITQTAIKDMRTDPNRCGIVTGLIDQFDVSGFFTAAQASFNEWFTNIQNQLGEDVAGHLLNLIQGVSNDLSSFKTQVEGDFQGVNQNLSQTNDKLKDLGKVKNTEGNLRLYTPILEFIAASTPPSRTGSGGYDGNYPLFSPNCTRAIVNIDSKLYYFNLEELNYSFISENSYPLYCDEDLFIVNNNGSALVYEWQSSGAPTLVKSFSSFSGDIFIPPTSPSFSNSGNWAFIGRYSTGYSSANHFWVYKYNKTTKDLSICYDVTQTPGNYDPIASLAQNGNDFFLSISIGTNNIPPISRTGKLLHVTNSGVATQMETYSGMDVDGAISMVVMGNFLYVSTRNGSSSYLLRKYSLSTYSKVLEVSISKSSLGLVSLGGRLVGYWSGGNSMEINPANLSITPLKPLEAGIDLGISNKQFQFQSTTSTIPIPLRDQVWMGLNSLTVGMFIYGTYLEFGGVPGV